MSLRKKGRLEEKTKKKDKLHPALTTYNVTEVIFFLTENP